MEAMGWLNKHSQSKIWGLQNRLWKEVGETLRQDHGVSRRLPGRGDTKSEPKWIKNGET